MEHLSYTQIKEGDLLNLKIGDFVQFNNGKRPAEVIKVKFFSEESDEITDPIIYRNSVSYMTIRTKDNLIFSYDIKKCGKSYNSEQFPEDYPYDIKEIIKKDSLVTAEDLRNLEAGDTVILYDRQPFVLDRVQYFTRTPEEVDVSNKFAPLVRLFFGDVTPVYNISNLGRYLEYSELDNEWDIKQIVKKKKTEEICNITKEALLNLQKGDMLQLSNDKSPVPIVEIYFISIDNNRIHDHLKNETSKNKVVYVEITTTAWTCSCLYRVDNGGKVCWTTQNTDKFNILKIIKEEKTSDMNNDTVQKPTTASPVDKNTNTITEEDMRNIAAGDTIIFNGTPDYKHIIEKVEYFGETDRQCTIAKYADWVNIYLHNNNDSVIYYIKNCGKYSRRSADQRFGIKQIIKKEVIKKPVETPAELDNVISDICDHLAPVRHNHTPYLTRAVECIESVEKLDNHIKETRENSSRPDETILEILNDNKISFLRKAREYINKEIQRLQKD